MRVVRDITPDHEPVKLLRSLEEKASESVAAFVVLLNKDDSLQYDGCGICAKDLLWVLEKMKKEILEPQ